MLAKSDYELDVIVRERRNNFWKPVDKIVCVNPEGAVAFINTKYSGNSHEFGKRLKNSLVKNLDSFISVYEEFFNVPKRK